MLKISLNTTYLDLDPKTALSLAVHNPLFDGDGAESVYSLPFKLPATPRNLQALEHANRLDRSSNTVTHNGTSAGAPTFLLAGSANFSAVANATLTLVLDGLYWRETARTVP